MIQSKMGILTQEKKIRNVCLKPPRKKCGKIDFIDGSRWSELFQNIKITKNGK